MATFGGKKQGVEEGRGEGKEDWRDMPLVSIHLPFYNEANVARRVIQACLAQDYPNLEVLVADDSRDDTIQVLKDPGWRKCPPVVKFIHRCDRSGFKGGALSEALRFMDPRAEFVVVFDADFIPPPDTVRRFIKKFREDDPTRFGTDFLPDLQPAASPRKPVAAVQGYQLHYLNKSENWVTRGIRAEFSGSYMVERVAEERLGAMKMISGSVFMLRADVLRRLKWGKSITEDWELTIRLYREGYRVSYTPLIQAPAEMPTTIRALARQRMRWAEGHTHAVRKNFVGVLRSAKLTAAEKLEFLYFAPYYLQSIMLLAGSAFWLMAEVNHRYPWFWLPAFGWSLLVSNLLAAPLMCLEGLWLEGDLRADYSGAFGLVALTYILAPYQGYAALRGLLEREEGGWIRTLKTGSVTDRFLSVRLRGLLRWLTLGGRLSRLSPRFGVPEVNLPLRGLLAAAALILLLLPPATALVLVMNV
ncbi:MAG: glycosyltransferase family 2 protein [Candidatus Bathyarchaeota archaeon]|nr:glycosyltransferase family 2 protein [Candidatus Bathyarchaeota archaeon]